jgi:hypothetical protein
MSVRCRALVTLGIDREAAELTDRTALPNDGQRMKDEATDLIASQDETHTALLFFALYGLRDHDHAIGIVVVREAHRSDAPPSFRNTHERKAGIPLWSGIGDRIARVYQQQELLQLVGQQADLILLDQETHYVITAGSLDEERSLARRAEIIGCEEIGSELELAYVWTRTGTFIAITMGPLSRSATTLVDAGAMTMR